MSMSNLGNLIVVGDRLLIKPLRREERTDTGLFLPPGVKEKEQVQQGYVVKLGPGYVVPTVAEDDELWKNKVVDNMVKYIPLQARVGDLAIFLINAATEVVYKKEKYYIVGQGAVLLLDRQ